MTPNKVPHLCGGILFGLLVEARKPRRKSRDKLKGGSDGLTMPAVYAGLIEVVTGEDLSSVAGDTLRKCATNYRKCDDSTGDYVPFTKVPVQSSFKHLYEKERPRLLKRMAGFIEQYLNNDKCIWLVSALIETMQKDPDIDDATEISVSHTDTMPVSQLQTAEKIVLLPFLLSVLHYVMINCPDCESGKATFEAWYSQAGPNTEWKFHSDIGSAVPAMTIDTDLTIPQTDTAVPTETAGKDLTVSQTDTPPADLEEMSDHEVITNQLVKSAQIMLTTFSAFEHQMAEEIRQKQKKQAPSEEEPAVEETAADENPETEQAAQPAVVHQTIVNQYGDHPVNIEHVENLKL